MSALIRPREREEKRTFFHCRDVMADAVIECEQTTSTEVERPPRRSYLNVAGQNLH